MTDKTDSNPPSVHGNLWQQDGAQSALQSGPQANMPTEAQWLDFSDALRVIRRGGKRIARRGWNGKNMWLRVRYEHSGISDDGFHRRAYIEMKTADNTLVPWLCSVTDMLAGDWMVLD